jgi:hypothetical protein
VLKPGPLAPAIPAAAGRSPCTGQHPTLTEVTMPVPWSEIEEQLARIGESDRWWGVPGLEDLHLIMVPGERIHAIVHGALSRRPLARKWLLLVTNHRLICLRRGGRFSRSQIDVPAAQITSINQHYGFLFTSITVVVNRRSFRFRIRKKHSLKFIGALSALVHGYHPPQQPAAAPLASSPAGAALPAGDYVTASDFDRLQETVEAMDNELRHMQQQIDFLQRLLERSGSPSLIRAAGSERLSPVAAGSERPGPVAAGSERPGPFPAGSERPGKADTGPELPVRPEPAPTV